MIIFAIKNDSNTAGEAMGRILHMGTVVFERLPIGDGMFDLYMTDSLHADSVRQVDDADHDGRRYRDRRDDDSRRYSRDRDDDRDDRRSAARDFFRRGYGPTTLSDYQSLAAHVSSVTDAETVLIITEKFNVATGDQKYIEGLFEASMGFYVDQFRNNGVIRTESVKLKKPDSIKATSKGTLNVTTN